MPGTNIAQLFAQQQGNAFSGSHPYGYQPALRPMQANPLAAMGGNVASKGGPATAQTLEEMAQKSPMDVPTKYASQDNGAQRLSSAGESSGVGFKHDDEGHLTGSSAFDSLDGYMKKAGLNSFQTQFFTRMAEQEMPEALVVAAIKSAGDQFGEKVGAELEDGWEKLAVGWRQGKKIWDFAARGLPFLKKQLFKPSTRQAATKGIQKATTSGKQVLDDIGTQTGRGAQRVGPKSVAKVDPKTTKQFEQLQQTFKPKSRTATSSMQEVLNTPSLRNQVANRSIEPTGLSRAYHGAKGALGDMFGPKGPANDAGAVQRFVRGGGAYNPINWLAPGRDARLGMANAVFNPHTGYIMPGNEGMYMNEDGSIDWSRVAANAAGNYLGAKTPIGARAMRRGMMAEGAGATLGYGTGLGMNALGYEVDSADLAERMANIGYNTGVASSPMSKGVTLKNVNRAARNIPGLRNAANTNVPGMGWADRFRNVRMFGSDAASARLNRKGAQNLKEIVPKASSLADIVDVPGRALGTAIRGTGLGARRATEYAMNNPGKAALGTAGTGGALFLGGKANNALNVMNETAYINNEVARMNAERAVQGLPPVSAPGQQPGGQQPGGQQPGGAVGGAAGGQQPGGAAGGQQPGGAPGQPPSVGGGLRQVGSGIYDTIESMFPDTGIADWINENKYMLMLGALGIGGGAMMGGGQGALLGGLATPLAYMLMKDQGLFDALDAQMGIAKQDGPAAPGSAGAGPGDVRNEVTSNQQGAAGQQGVPGQQGDAGGGIPGDADGDGKINAQEAKAIASNPGQITALVDHPDRLRLARQAALTNPEFANNLRSAARAGVSPELIGWKLNVDLETAKKIKQLAIQLQQQ